MKTTIEISNYPLSEEYISKIQDFIDRCNKHSGITIRTNATSTHIVGDYDIVMGVLKEEIKTSFEKYGKAIFVVKILNGALDI
jgi:uncharacterized protein YqgV (UPF0045/DUF77 family)